MLSLEDLEDIKDEDQEIVCHFVITNNTSLLKKSED